jgi:4-hydroxybenzoate polyprenyltransferase
VFAEAAMLDRISQRLLTLLQFTRMALVFTAISNSLCTLLLATRGEVGPDGSVLRALDWQRPVLVALISIGLYGYGMTLNDIIDRRRDRQLAAHRPLPSGRIALATAHVVCGLLILMAVVAGALYAKRSPGGWMSLVLVLWTAFLIAFYDFAGKYLVAVGLLTLGLIRFFHAVIPAPELPLLWHPLLLFTHVSVLSAVAYWWEEKRPPLTVSHWWAVLGGMGMIDILAISIVWWVGRGGEAAGGLGWRPGLLLPLGLAALFVIVAWRIKRKSATPRQAGQTLMLTGLLWLIAYDSAFVGVYVGKRYALALLLLLPLSYLMVLLMRWWSKLLSLSQPPEYKRVRSSAEVQGQP